MKKRKRIIPCWTCKGTGIVQEQQCLTCKGSKEKKIVENLYAAMFGPLHGQYITWREANNKYSMFHRSNHGTKHSSIWLYDEFDKDIKFITQYVKNV